MSAVETPRIPLAEWDDTDRADCIAWNTRFTGMDTYVFGDCDRLKLIIGDDNAPKSWLSSDYWVDAREYQ